MLNSYSIVEARNRFAELVHDLQRVGRIEVTRRGRRVAILLSVEEYERLRSDKPDFWSAYQAFRQQHDLASLDIGPEVFDGVRDRSTGREVEW